MTSIFLKTKKIMYDLISATMPRTKEIVHEKLGSLEQNFKKNKEV
jgi:hypothetical protein